MAAKLASGSRIAHIRSRILQDMLPDVCTLNPKTVVETAWGGSTIGKGTARQYNGSTQIPCALMIARHYREASMAAQPTAVNEFELHLPFDCAVGSTDLVTVNERVYEIRKMMDNVTWQGTKSFMVSELVIGQ